MSRYWIAAFIFCFLLSFASTLTLYGFAFLFSVATFKNAAFWLFIDLALLWAVASTGYAFVLGAAIRSSKVRSVSVVDASQLRPSRLGVLVTRGSAASEEWLPCRHVRRWQWTQGRHECVPAPSLR